MFCHKPLEFCIEFIAQLNNSLESLHGRSLSHTQRCWLGLCITGILLTNSVCWKRIERLTLGRYCASTISKMFCRAKINWSLLLQASIQNILQIYDIHKGVLVLDDTGNHRSKKTNKIAKVHKTKDKGTGGYFNGQEIVFLVLVTGKVTIPVGFEFYEPNPEMSKWRKEYKQQKKLNVPKQDRVKKPDINEIDYPTKTQIASSLVTKFATDFPYITIQCLLADALYGTNKFFNKLCTSLGVQIISQIKHNQKVKAKGKYVSVDEYFKRYSYGVYRKLPIRGGLDKNVFMDGARLHLKAHGCERFIIAIKYEGEENYRYLVASDLTWRLTDIASAYTLRWLVEVFIQDWKSYEGWCQLAKQPGDEGSSKGLILSLLTDHCLLLHPEQKALINRKLPALTVGSLRDLIRVNAVIESLQSLLKSEESQITLNQLSQKVAEVIPMRESSKHMSGRNLGRLEPSSSLLYKKVA